MKFQINNNNFEKKNQKKNWTIEKFKKKRKPKVNQKQIMRNHF